MANPAQEPPQARGIGAVALIVGYDLDVLVDAPAAQGRRPVAAVGQRMATAAAGNGASKIAVEVRVERMRYMATGIGALAPIRFRKLETAVEDRTARVCDDGSKLGRFDQCRVHEGLFWMLCIFC